MEPLTEIVEDGVNGLVVASDVIGYTKSGVQSHESRVHGLARALDEITDPGVRERLVAGTVRVRVRESLDWSQTVLALDNLVQAVKKVKS